MGPVSEIQHNEEVLWHPRVPALHHFSVQHTARWGFTMRCGVSMWDILQAGAAPITRGPGGFSECSYEPDGLLHKLQQSFPPSPVHSCFRRCRGEAGGLFLPPLIVAVVILRERGNSFLHVLGSVTCRSV